MSILPVGDVCQVATVLLKGIRAVGESARDHKEALPKILLLEGTLRQLEEVQAREQKNLKHRRHHVEEANALESLQELCEQLKEQVRRAKKMASKKGWKLKMQAIQGALFGGSDVVRIASNMESLMTSWLKLQNVPLEVREALQKNSNALPAFLEVQADHGYVPLAKVDLIKDLLQNSENKVLLIHGMTGIGKSCLARYVAADPPERFSDGALELVFGQACSITAAGNDYHSLLAAKLCVLLRKLGCKKDQLDGLNLDNACELLQEVLTGKSYLILLDDVWEAEVTSRFTKLSGNDCKILVTTRLESVHAIAEADKVEIKGSDVREVGKAILKYHTQLEELPAGLWEVLLQRCGYHPLTISVIGEALNGETRVEEWEKAIENLSMYAAKATVPSGYQTGLDGSANSTVFGSFQFSLRALPKEARQLFTAFSLFLWNEPIPEKCLEKVWEAFTPNSLFRLEVQKLVKGSLISKRDDNNYCYTMHDMVSLFLDNEYEDAVKMLQLSEISGSKACQNWGVASAWLFRYGRPQIRKAAVDYMTESLMSDISVLQATILREVVDLLDAVSALSELSITSELFLTSERYKNVLDVEIIYLVACGDVHYQTALAIAHYIGNVYAPKDYKRLACELINRGMVHVLGSVLQQPGTMTESTYEALNVLYELVKVAESQSTEALLRDAPVRGLVEIYHVGVAMDILERLCEMGGEAAVEAIFEAGLWQKLAKDCKDNVNALQWPRRERSIIRDRFMSLLSNRSHDMDGGGEAGSVGNYSICIKRMEQKSMSGVQEVLREASEALAMSCRANGDGVMEEGGGEEEENEDGKTLALISRTLRGMRGAAAKGWEETMRYSGVTGSVLQAMSLYIMGVKAGGGGGGGGAGGGGGVVELAAECLCEINYHPSAITILEEVLTGDPLDVFMKGLAADGVPDDVSCKLFEVLETLMNGSVRQEEIVTRGGVQMLFQLMMKEGEARPKLQEKALFYVVFSPLHVKREPAAWIGHLLEGGVVEALAIFPSVKHSANLPVLPFWFLSKFGTSIAKTDKLQVEEQGRLAAEFMRRMKAAIPQMSNGGSAACGEDQDIASIERLIAASTSS